MDFVIVDLALKTLLTNRGKTVLGESVGPEREKKNTAPTSRRWVFEKAREYHVNRDFVRNIVFLICGFCRNRHNASLLDAILL